jgi:hypothetical protein
MGAALALPAGALAQVPGAHYSGTTADNYPISFDVSADGTSLTNVVTTVNSTPCGPYSTNSPFAFPIAGGTISGDDPDTFPRLKMRGTFSSPQEASGTLSTSNGQFSNGVLVFCNVVDRAWSASTTAIPGGGGSDPGGNDPGGNDPGGNDPGGNDPGGNDPGGGGGGGSPTISLTIPGGIKLKPSLSNSFILGMSLGQPSNVTAKLILAGKTAKKYGLGSKAVTVSKASAKNAGADSSLEFKFKKAIRKALKNAKKLKFKIEFVVIRLSDGAKGSGSSSITLG